ncbi:MULTISPECIES: NB-ARC domain-containing protein [unclassified Coleofasciculus]|uniref:NB-ARC domain-containing protein n=1 Tax=unclassified Coleofasciculus TaxID=2692782 RepID=UPI00187F598B|nr:MULTISPECIES: NB-ARC domain-containing protein [unclassified Coleofasciculus]MBE9130125.1 NACHT domain-containing protein [Coleofasciculus sp. LEGE 07081]MBE9152470.1 NACHT domain-containing protein [Coleofasciculus sp. LEGE 07092]
MPTLKASQAGITRIKQARNEKGWGWSLDEDDTCLIEASLVLEPDKNWQAGSFYANGISQGTWKRFLAGRQPISAVAFKAYCQVLGLNWEDIVDRRNSTMASIRQDWGEAIDISLFYGRTPELAQLEQWIVEERCHLVAILGMGGIGKTVLAVKLAEEIQQSFEYLIWRSLRHAPPVGDILADLIEFLSDGREPDLPPTADGRVSRLIDSLQAHRCLLFLDDVETVMSSEELAGNYREGYEEYGELIRRVGEERHQSCVVLLSREKPAEIASLAGTTLPVRALKLKGLSREDAKRILEAKGVSRLKRGLEELIQLYRGNPLALKIIATTIQELFDGDISQFLEQSTLIIGDILPNLLNEQVQRLSSLEKEILYWFAIENQPISLSELRGDMQFSVSSSSQLIPALESLKRRSLLEKEPSSEGNETVFTVQPVILKYVTYQFIDRVCKDIVALCQTQSLAQLGLLRSHALVKEQELDDTKEIQIRTILTRITDRLYRTFKGASTMETCFEEVLSKLEGTKVQTAGYGRTNLLNLLGAIKGSL